MKKFLLGFLLGAVIFSGIVYAANYEALPVTFSIYVDGKLFASEPGAVAIDGRTFLPLRAIGDALGVQVEWNQDKFRVEVGTPPVDEQPTSITFNAGMYKVGTDIPQGDYLIVTNESTYLEVTSDSTGSFESILYNANFENSQYINIKSGQYLMFRKGTAYPIDTAPVLKPIAGKYLAGMYKIGRDIPPGEYKVVPTESNSGYYEILKGLSGDFDDLETNGIVENTIYLTLSSGYVEVSRAYIIAK